MITRSQPQPYGTSGTEIRWTLTDATMNGSARYTVWRDETVDVMVKTGVWNTTGEVVNYLIATNTIVGEYDYYIIICDGFNLLNHNTTSSNSHIYIENNIPTFGYSQGLFYRFGTLNEKSVNFTITDDGSWTSQRRYTIIMKNNSAGGAQTVVQTGFWNTGSQIKYFLPYFNMVTGTIENEDADNYDYYMWVTDGFDQPLYYVNQTTDMIRVSICRFDTPIINDSTSPFSIPFGTTQNIKWQVNGTDIKPVPTGTTGNYSLFHKELTGMFVLIRVGTWQDGSIIDYNIPTDLVVGVHRYRLEVTSGYVNVTHDIYITILNNLPMSNLLSTENTFMYGCNQPNKNITWQILDDNSYLGYPATMNLKYSILRNGTYVAVGSWTVGTQIVYFIPDSLGAELITIYYNFSILFSDGYENVTSPAKWIAITPNEKATVYASDSIFRTYNSGFDITLNWMIIDTTVNGSRAYSIHMVNSTWGNTTYIIMTGVWNSGINITYTIPQNIFVGNYTYYLNLTDGYSSAIGPSHNVTFAGMVAVEIANNLPFFTSLPMSSKQPWDQHNTQLSWGVDDDDSIKDPVPISQTYSIYRNGSRVAVGTWTRSSNIVYTIPAYMNRGMYTFTVEINDGFGVNVTSAPRNVEICNIAYFQVLDSYENPVSGIQFYILLQGNPLGNNISATNSSGNATFWDLTVGGYYRVMINHTDGFGKQYIMYNTTGYDVYFGPSTNVRYITYRILITNLEMKIVQCNGVAQINATVTFTNIATPILSYQGVTNINGNVSFQNIRYDSGQWRIIVTEWLNGDFFTLLNTTMNIFTNQFVLYPEFYHNLIGVRFNFIDLDDNSVTNAEVTVSLNSNPNINWTGTTDGTGQVLFQGLYNATWRLLVKGILFSTSEYIILETTYLLNTASFFIYESVATQCNQTLLTIHTIDSDILDPAFYDIHNAQVKIYHPESNQLLGTYFSDHGFISILIPRTILNFTVSFNNKIKYFIVISPAKANATHQIIDFVNEISTFPTTLTFNITTNILPNFTIGIIIPSEIRLSVSEIRASLWDNITFTITINDGVENPTLAAILNFDGGNPTDLSAYIYPINSIHYLFSMQANVTTIGNHSIRIVVTKTGYEETIQTIQVNIISEWGTRLRIVEPMGIYNWGEKAYYIVNYYSIEDPRTNMNLANGIALELRLYPVANPTQIITLTYDQNGTNWGNIDLSKIGEIQGFPGTGQYDDGYYLIWFNTDLLGVNAVTEFTAEIVFKSYTYNSSTKGTNFIVDTLDTNLTATAYEGQNNTVISDLSAANFTINYPLYLILNWRVNDSSNPYYNSPVTGINGVSYIITRQNDSTTTIGNAILLGNGLYNISLNTTQNGNYIVVVTATLMNYTTIQYSTSYIIGFDQPASYPPEAPTLSFITPNPNVTGNITLNWSAVSGALNYRVYRHTQLITEIIDNQYLIATVTQTQYTDNNLSNGTYYYVVRAYNNSGLSELSNCVNVTVQIPPTPNNTETTTSTSNTSTSTSTTTTSNPISSSTSTTSTQPTNSQPFRVDGYSFTWIIIGIMSYIIIFTYKKSYKPNKDKSSAFI
jgi:hypothetical protein